ncbi:hypothetical protein M670_02181 [Schinkia azotoformans MEV2011]|uniref:Periplasmic component of the Tol biopolymer transport system n=1 Tax=Schinkia azotoformans MEV2011 TaxID=1348973 RepID=A0A072NZ81_SCHAZ|nr:hypothetical protein [Schinkia azotoformans]KEF38555.1 hypothetical protein M670_02181 [Schinkia azotoformans MEV2011]MEC1695163.1 hypothetical protein [Schinkia azotoformans]MEC1717592.1 hypothetical protein [Schinkia azotoformans]MEC1723778.1 hypothetical protein [Schinkia azotoformans]MEC1742329.1 hypothetical protein [Schinkia azotoformans]
MDDKIEKNLHELKEQIYVNKELKQDLRKTFAPKSKRRINLLRNPWISGLLAAAVFIAFYFSNSQPDHFVKASSLNITNSISFLDIGSGEVVAYSHQKGSLYVSLRDQGIFKYTNEGLTNLTKEVADSMSQSIIEDQLLFSQNGTIYILALQTKESKEIMKGTSDISYSQPTWKDKNTIYVTKNEGSKSEIVEINLKTMKETSETKGSSPIFAEKEKKLIFERDSQIFVKDIKNGEESLVDKGIDPAVSTDGAYISYVKNINGFDDVWIKDLNLKTVKKVSTNLPPRFENVKQGLYQYTLPIWSSNERSLYVLKQRQNDLNAPIQIMKISLNEKAISAEETVERYLQALIVRDDDYAKSMMEQPPEFITVSNPHQIGYDVISSKEKNGITTVTANVYWTYTANPYYKVGTYQFELKQEKSQYIIQNIAETESVEVTSGDFSNELYLVKDGGNKELLFSLTDIPKEFLQTDSVRISPLVISSDEKDVIFSLQEMAEKVGEPAGVTILKYDRDQKTFTEISRLEPKSNSESLVIEQMSLDSTGQYVVADVFSEPGFVPKTYLFDVVKGEKVDQFTGSHSLFWQNQKLIMQVMDENKSMLYEFDPKTNEKYKF